MRAVSSGLVRLGAALLAATVIAAVGAPAPASAQGAPAGAAASPLAGSAPATVLVFTATDCPISNRYAPEVQRLAARHAAAGVRVWLVYPNVGEKAEAAKAHAAAFGYGLPVVLDADGALTARTGATVTPEVAVLDRTGQLVYRGRIDDRYVDFGVDRPVPTTHELADTIDAVLAGRPVAVPRTHAVGCAIVRATP